MLRRSSTRARLTHVPLTASEVSLYYDGFSNAVLWPLFHYLLDKVRLDAVNEWRAYKAVNERFADAIAAELRARRHGVDPRLSADAGTRTRCAGCVPKARIGFFLHVPWPSSDVFRILPLREQLLEGLLGADLIGFHTESYRHNFIHSAAKVLGAGSRRRQLELGRSQRAHRRVSHQHRSRDLRAAIGEPWTTQVAQLRAGHGRQVHAARRGPARLHQGRAASPAGRRPFARARAPAARAACISSSWPCPRAKRSRPTRVCAAT